MSFSMSVCQSRWDKSGDGELLKEEEEVVKRLCRFGRRWINGGKKDLRRENAAKSKTTIKKIKSSISNNTK